MGGTESTGKDGAAEAAPIGRRQFLAGAAAAAVGAQLPQAALAAKPDHHLRIGPVSLELAPGHVVQTLGYNGRIPGPLIRAREGEAVRILVENQGPAPDIVHWHGLKIPALMDGAMEEGSPMIRPGGSFLYHFAADPAGTRWYHSHARAGTDLEKSLYTGQYGFFQIDARSEPGRYDREVFLALHHWEPSWVILQDRIKGPPADDGLEVAYKSASINGRALGHGEPLRVRRGERVLFRLLNASATQAVPLALPGHRFRVVAMDGNPVPHPQSVDRLLIAPAERIDAVVEMTEPGIWVLGSIFDGERASGMGVVVEYAGASGPPQWRRPEGPLHWDYTIFGKDTAPPAPENRVELVFQKIPGGRGGYNRWTINGKSWPKSDPILVEKGKRYRFVMHNLSGDMHPIHTHRHSFELASFMGKPSSGLIKDVVMLPGRQSGEFDLVADNPGPALFHCHMQDHMDFGFMALIKYA